MKIVCSRCNRVLGEQEPLDNTAEVKVKCTDCIENERLEAARFHPMPKPGESLEVVLGKGLKGTLWVAAEEKDRLSPWELAVAGRKFHCSESTREEFQQYLASIKEEEPKTTFFYSMSISMKPPARARKKGVPEKEHRGDSIKYNCTVKLLKYYIQRIFNEKSSNISKFLDIIADSASKMYIEEAKAYNAES